MFESLGDRLQNVLHKVKGYGKITEDNISDMMREIRLALLEADVNYKVVKEFTNSVKEKALGEEVASSINPGDLFVKIVKDELVELLGGKKNIINIEASMSRFKATLNDVSLANKDGIQKLGAKGIVEIDNQLKIVFDSDAVKLKKCIEDLLKENAIKR